VETVRRLVMRRRYGFAALAALVATIWAANWLISRYGIVDVGFGLGAPAGVYAAGAAFTLRDIAHRALGAAWVIGAVAAGAGVSWLLAPAFAVGSAVAFLASELADLAVYTPLARRTWLGALALSNTAGLAVDSALFLLLAFGSLAFFWGQAVGKAWATLIAVTVLTAIRHHRALLPRHP
jgi:queuosine precursor transporter